jgi:hypothetical protein
MHRHEPHSIIDDATRRFAACQGPPPPERPGPIAGPRRPPPWLSIALIVAAILGLIIIASLLAARPSPDAVAAPPQSVAAIAPTPTVTPQPQATTDDPVGDGIHVLLAPGTVANYAPQGDAYGDVSGRSATLVATWAGTWAQADIEGAGRLWVPMRALVGQAVALESLPNLSPPPTPTAVPWVPPPPPKEHVVLNPDGSSGGNALEVFVYPTIDISQVPTARP